MLLFLGTNQTVVSVLTAVNNIYVPCVHLPEYKKLMSEKIHLKDRLLGVHGHDRKMLVFNYLNILFIFGIILRILKKIKSSRPELFFHTGLVLAKLPTRSSIVLSRASSIRSAVFSER